MPGSHRVALVLMVCFVFIAAPSARADFEDPGATGPDAVVYQPAFADVPTDHLFASSIRALFAARVTQGCNESSTDFCPDVTVTRGQMAAFLARALDLPESPSTQFTDDNQSTFENDIEKLAAAGITKGCNPPDNDRFCPNRAITRGQMAAFLTRGLPLSVPPGLPDGVSRERAPSNGGGTGTQVTVCSDAERSLLVRSVTGATPGLEDARPWEPTSLDLSRGELDLTTDRWYLPAFEGCQTLDVAWDPGANELSAPLPSLQITSPFGYRFHPILRVRLLHAGTDFDADAGDPVRSGAPGVVVYTGTRGGYGNLVEVRHAGGLDTRYAHLSSIDVSVGDIVSAGDVLGAIGCTGLCTGPHLHFETREFGIAVDPMTYLDSSGTGS